MSFWEILTLAGTTATILGVFLTIHAMIDNKTLSFGELLILAGTMATILGLFLTLHILLIRRR